MKSIKYLAFPLLSVALVIVRAVNQQRLQMLVLQTQKHDRFKWRCCIKCPKFGRSKGVTEANKAALAKRVVLTTVVIYLLKIIKHFKPMSYGKCKLKSCIDRSYRWTREYNMALGERRAKAVQSLQMV